MIRVIIAEDEPLARARIVRMLKKNPEIQIVAECANGRQAVEALCGIPSDLLFLDVQMPEMDGFEVLASLDAGSLPCVIFVTAYEQYALRAFDACALDYLLKPFNEARLLQAFKHAETEIQKNRAQEARVKLEQLLEGWRRDSKGIQRILLKKEGRAWFLKVSEIDWIEADAKNVRIHCGQNTFVHRQSLMQLLSGLDPSQFIRIHRSTIVNIDRIREIEPQPSGDARIHMRSGDILTASRTYRKNLQH